MISDNRQLYRSEAGFLQVMKAYDLELDRWEVQPESLSIQTRYGDTHVLRAGDPAKPALMFFHGWSGNASGTRTELDLVRLSQNFCIYSPDTIGQSGKSASSRPDTVGRPYGDWIVDLFDGLNINEVYVSGISGGGYLSLKAASYAPDKVKGVFAMSSAGLVSLSRPPIRFLFNAIQMMMGLPWGARNFAKMMLAPDFQDEAVIEEMAQGMKMMIGHMKPVAGPKALSDEELRRIQCPVKIVMGKYDMAVHPHKTIERAEQFIPNVQTHLIEAGHIVTLEKRDWLMAELVRFFAMDDA